MIEPGGLACEGAGEPCFAGAGLSGDDEVLFGLHPRALRQLQDIAPIEPAPGAEVDIFDAGIGEAQRRRRQTVGQTSVAHRPYEFGIKVSVATTAHRSKGGQFVTHIAALPGNPYDGHTLAIVIPALENMIGNTIERLLADAGYRGHNAPTDYKFRVYTSGQKRRHIPQIKRELRRRAAIEPVIGHLKAEHRMGRNYLAHRAGDAVNAALAAAGYNFHLLLKWLELLLSRFLAAQKASGRPSIGLRIKNFTDD
jgi:hypothetical protein